MATLDPGVRVVVVSDTHIGSGEIDDFKPELEEQLVLFLDRLAASSGPTELVVNGDFCDFVTAAPWDDVELESRSDDRVSLCFTQEQSSRKFKGIINDHRPVFDALGRFLLDRTHQLTFLPGNHDADLFWPDVRVALIESLTSRGADAIQIRFVLERAYVIQRGDQRYWIEHGHQHDRPNSFFVNGKEVWSKALPPILVDEKGSERLYECPGTIGLVRHINGWRQRYLSIGYIKPHSRSLKALVSYKGFREHGRPLHIVRQLVAYLGWQVDLETRLDDPDPVQRARQDLLQQMAANLSDEEEQSFVASLAEHGMKLGSTLRTSVATPYGCDRIITGMASAIGAVPHAPSVRLEDRNLGFVFGEERDVETEVLRAMADRLVKDGKADYVVTGHTHTPEVSLGGRFINGGCWIPNLTVDSASEAQRVIFEHGSVPYNLSYVDIPVGSEPKLESYKRGRLLV